MYVHRVRTLNMEINNEEINGKLSKVDKSLLKKGDIISVNEEYDLEVTGYDGYIIDLVVVERGQNKWQ